LDADKEGFLRSERSLVQTIGRAARNENGKVIMYADRITDSMERAIFETNRRRATQEAYNIKHGITPTTIIKEVRDRISISHTPEDAEGDVSILSIYKAMTMEQRREALDQLDREMREAAKALNFEKAAEIRDMVLELKAEYKGL
jgi:excinuclease ABC subunit B